MGPAIISYLYLDVLSLLGFRSLLAMSLLVIVCNFFLFLAFHLCSFAWNLDPKSPFFDLVSGLCFLPPVPWWLSL